MPRPFLILVFLACLALACGGCKNIAPNPANSQAANTSIDPQKVQSNTMSFAVRYTTAMADVFNRVEANITDPAVRQTCLNGKLLAGWGSMSNAVNPNPIVGLMDMALMVTLTRATLTDPWAKDTFGEANQRELLSAIEIQENNIWSLAGSYLTPAQIKELHDLADRWRKDHPEQRLVGSARLVDFPEAKQSAAVPGLQIASGVFNLVRLDPFAGLDPAVAQVEESRVLAERMFFYLQNLPILLSWQTDFLYGDMLLQPQTAQLLKDTNAFTVNTGQFSKATQDFADASSRIAGTVEAFRKELPDQQAMLVKQVGDQVGVQRDAALKQANDEISAILDATVKQLNDVVAAQRDAALKQAGEQIGQQRDAAIKQLDATVTAQQDLMAKNLQGVLNGSIDRLYWSLFWLILTAALALLAVLFIHRFVVRALFDGKRR